jgi:hypothetical protein
MSRQRGRGHINPPYQPSTPAGYLDPDPEPDDDATVPVSDVQQEALIALAEADASVKRWFDSPVGKVWQIIVGIFGILITISLGILILTGIWGAIFS